MTVTVLGPGGYSRPPYASFAGKPFSSGDHKSFVQNFSVLGPGGYPKELYGSFAGKTAQEESTVSGADGPPWHLTQKELKRLLHYREELAEIQKAYDLKRRRDVEELLRDVNLAAGRIQDEPELIFEEPEFIPAIEKRILALPQLPKKSLYNLDLRELKRTIDINAWERELEDDEESLMLLL